LLERLVAQTATALKADGCAVWLRDETQNLVPAAHFGLADDLVRTLLDLLSEPRPRVRGRGAWRTTWERVRDTRAPYFTRDERRRALEDGDRLGEAFADDGIVSAGRLPLFEPGGGVMGMLALYHRHERAYGESEVRLAQAFADQIAAAIHNAQLHKQTQEAVRTARALSQTAASLTVDQPMQETLNALAAGAMRATGAAAAAVLLTDPVTARTQYAGAAGFPEGLVERLTALPGEATGLGHRDEILGQQEPEIVTNLRQAVLANPHYAPVHYYAELVDWETSVGMPMLFHGRVLGFVNAYYGPQAAPGPEQIALLRPIADQAAVVVENARLFLEARDKASLEERTRLAHDLHDSVTQTVFSLGMLARAAQAQYERRSTKLGNTLDRVATLAQEALVEMRALLFELRPLGLSDEGLSTALAKLVEVVRTRSGVAITYTATGDVRLAPEMEMAVFRIVQEALANVVKHAHAGAAAVTLTAGESGLTVQIRDTGAGFDPAAPVAATADGTRGGQGMRSMRERAAAAGVGLLVESAPGRGTTVTIEASVGAIPAAT
jgi:signal transduction histidine kinase